MSRIALRALPEAIALKLNGLEDVREKIDEAIAASENTPPIDGETFVNQIIERFQKVRQAQE